MSRGILLALAAALLLWPRPGLGADQTAGFDRAAVDAYVEEMMQQDRIPGVAIALVHDQRIVYVRGYGEDGRGQPIHAETGFILGSMSKSFTALAIMQLVERGSLELDTPAQHYLPTFRVADPTASARITVRHLLNHTSGIPARAPRAQQTSASLQDHVEALAGVSLNHPPGATHEYASPNYLVLGAIVERVSGQSFGAYLGESIFTPLQMRHSFTDPAQAGPGGMSRGHRYWFGVPVPADLPYEADRMPTAAVISSAQDLAHYLLAHLNEGRFGEAAVLSPAGMSELLRPNAPGDGFSYAMGWRVGPVQGVPAVHHGGILPHFRGKLVLLPEQRWGVAVLTNASTGMPLPIAPSSHRMADGLAAYLAGQPLAGSAYSQGAIYLAVSLGMGLVLLGQIRELLRIGRWRQRVGSERPWRLWFAVGADLLWPVVALVALPLLIGLPWPELAQASPDMTAWLLLSVVLSALTGLRKGAVLLAATRSAGSGHGHTAG